MTHQYDIFGLIPISDIHISGMADNPYQYVEWKESKEKRGRVSGPERGQPYCAASLTFHQLFLMTHSHERKQLTSPPGIKHRATLPPIRLQCGACITGVVISAGVAH